MMMIKLAMVSVLLLAIPFDAAAAKVKARFIDQDKKAVVKSESKLVEKSSGKEYFGKVNKKGEAEFDKIEPGDYQLYGQSQGYMPNKSDWLSVPEKETSFTLTLVAENYYRKKEQDGNTALTQGKFAEAAGHYEKLLELMPKEGSGLVQPCQSLRGCSAVPESARGSATSCNPGSQAARRSGKATEWAD
jgi:hypothetical protein